MKNIFLILNLISLGSILSAQKSGLIKYKETIKLDIQLDMPDGVDIAGMLPESTTINKELYFNGKQSVYIDGKDNESTDMEMESDDGSMKIVFKMDENEEIYYSDLKRKKLTHQTGFMGKEFIIEENVEKAKWKLTGEKIKYLDYECHKAELIIPAESDKGEDKLVVAWFAPAIPVPLGPSNFNSLPGVILMLSIDGDKHEFMATEIDLNIDPTEKIKLPSKGKKVTAEEFENIIDEKEKEMKELGGNVIIRN